MNNSTPTFALMAGLPATGKTTIVRALGHDLDWYVIDKDGYKQEFLDEGDDHTEASRKAYNKSFDVACTKLIQERTSVIFDSPVLDTITLNKDEDIILTFRNIELKVILCITSRELRLARMRQKQSYSATKLDPHTRAEYLHIFRHLPSNRLELDTNEPLGTCLEKARKYLLESQEQPMPVVSVSSEGQGKIWV